MWDTLIGCFPHAPWPGSGIKPKTQIWPLYWESNPLPFRAWANALTSEPTGQHWSLIFMDCLINLFCSLASGSVHPWKCQWRSGEESGIKVFISLVSFPLPYWWVASSPKSTILVGQPSPKASATLRLQELFHLLRSPTAGSLWVPHSPLSIYLNSADDFDNTP